MAGGPGALPDDRSNRRLPRLPTPLPTQQWGRAAGGRSCPTLPTLPSFPAAGPRVGETRQFCDRVPGVERPTLDSSLLPPGAGVTRGCPGLGALGGSTPLFLRPCPVGLGSGVGWGDLLSIRPQASPSERASCCLGTRVRARETRWLSLREVPTWGT